MKILDVNKNERNIIDGSLKVISHEVPATGPHAKEGETISKKFVQVMIKPHFDTRSPYPQFIPLDKFKELNPDIKLE